MTRIRPQTAAALALLAGLAGCHLMPKSPPAGLASGPGRVEHACAAGVEPTFKATLGALDDLGVRAEGVSLGDGHRDLPLNIHPQGRDQPRTNLEAFGPGGDGLHQLFLCRRVKVPMEAPGQPVTPLECNFDPTVLTYRGRAADGRAVEVVARAKRSGHPDDASDAETTVQAQVGTSGDDAWGRSFLDKLAARLDREKSKPAAPASADARAASAAPGPSPVLPDAPVAPR